MKKGGAGQSSEVLAQRDLFDTPRSLSAIGPGSAHLLAVHDAPETETQARSSGSRLTYASRLHEQDLE